MLYENPDLYDELQPASATQVSFYTTLAQRRAGPVLELACGSGQLILPIASAGVSITGLDHSPQMLAAARRRVLSVGARVDLIESDMREFDLERQFSLIFVARNSLLHLHTTEDFAALFTSVRRHLLPDGMLAFDVFNPNLRVLSHPRGARMRIMRFVSPRYGEITVESTNDYDPALQVNRATWFISTAQRRDQWVVPIHLRSLFPQELLSLLAANGFCLLRRDGDFAGGEFAGESFMQVCQCRPV